MNRLILSLAFLSSACAFASATAPATTELCMSLSATELSTGNLLGQAQCEITQGSQSSSLASSWSCSFNGQRSQTLSTIATWVAEPTSDQGSTIFYDIYSQEDLGSYLIKGLNMANVSDGALLEIVEGATPHAVLPNLMFSTTAGTYDYLNVLKVTTGSCN